MNNEIDTALLKSIIDTEFSVIASKSNKKKCNLDVGSKLNCSNSKVSYSLNLFELVKTLKELVRILQFLKKQRWRKLNICSSVENVISFVKAYQEKLILSDFVLVEKKLSQIKKQKKFNDSYCLLSIEGSTKSKISTSTKLFEKNILLVVKVNSAFEFKSCGNYKIYNDVSNFKKLAFLMTIVDYAFNG
jgi:hypothetical protein